MMHNARAHAPLIKEGSRLDGYLSKRFSSAYFSYREIFAMLGPLILDQFFIYAIGVLTTAMISSSGQDSVTAVNMVSPVTMLVQSLFFAISSGGTVIVAQYKGKGDERMMRRSASQVILSTFLTAAFVAIILIVFAHPIVNFFFSEASEAIRFKAANYMRGFSFSLFFFSLYNGVFAVLRGMGDTKTCLQLTIVINVLHLLGSLLFINVMKLDIMGTALSFNVCRFFGGAMAVFIILNPRRNFSLTLRDLISWDNKIVASILKIGVPFATEQIFLNLGALVAQMYITTLSETSMAANAIALSASNLFYGTGFAVAHLAITVVGQCIGAGDTEQAKKYGKHMTTLGTAIMILSLVIIYPLMPLILKMYNPLPETLVLIKRLITMLLIPIPLFWAHSQVMPSVLRSAGDATYTSVVGMICMWAFRVGLGYLLAIVCKLDVYGVWIGLASEWAARAILFRIRFAGKKWYSKKIV